MKQLIFLMIYCLLAINLVKAQNSDNILNITGEVNTTNDICNINLVNALRSDLCNYCVTIENAVSLALPQDEQNGNEFQNEALFNLVQTTLLDADFMSDYDIDAYKVYYGIYTDNTSEYVIDWKKTENLASLSASYLIDELINSAMFCGQNNLRKLIIIISPHCTGNIVPLVMEMNDDGLVYRWALSTGIIASVEDVIAARLLNNSNCVAMDEVSCWLDAYGPTIDNPCTTSISDIDLVAQIGKTNSDLKQEISVESIPNIFNHSTTISYTLKEEMPVELSIYNLQGKEVSRLVNNKWQEAGSHQIVFDATHLAEGMYIYHFNAGNQQFSGKLFKTE